jgi:hypothetical protein
MTDSVAATGWAVLDAERRRIGTVDAVFADYLLIRTRGLLPVDLYVPITAVRPTDGADAVEVAAADVDAAYRSWHRPLKKAPHE